MTTPRRPGARPRSAPISPAELVAELDELVFVACESLLARGLYPSRSRIRAEIGMGLCFKRIAASRARLVAQDRLRLEPSVHTAGLRDDTSPPPALVLRPVPAPEPVHVSDRDLARFAAGELCPSHRGAVWLHVERCQECRDRVPFIPEPGSMEAEIWAATKAERARKRWLVKGDEKAIVLPDADLMVERWLSRATRNKPARGPRSRFGNPTTRPS